MSINSLSKSASYSHSPAMRQQINQIGKINQHYMENTSTVFPESRDSFTEDLLKKKFKSIHAPLAKIVKIASKQKIVKQNMNTSYNFSGNSSLHQIENPLGNTKKINIENILLENLKNEKSIEKKFDIVISTVEKLINVDRNFSIFYKVVKSFLTEYKENVINKCESLNKYEELGKNYKESKDLYEKLFDEFVILRRENDILKVGFEKMKEENNSLKFKVKRNAAFLKKLKESGIPVEQMYKDVYKNTIKSKSVNKILFENCDSGINSNERPNSIPENKNKIIPKLKIEITNGEGYQDEFMSKFNEFSESWRKQIIKDHHLINN